MNDATRPDPEQNRRPSRTNRRRARTLFSFIASRPWPHRRRMAVAALIVLPFYHRRLTFAQSTAQRRHTMPTQAEKAAAFQALHQRPGIFVIANPWDAGTARILTGLGFRPSRPPARGSPSRWAARWHRQRDPRRSPGQREGHRRCNPSARCRRSRERLWPRARRLRRRPSASPQTAGLVGGSIEDATGDPAHPIYDFNHAVERVAAAAAAARCACPSRSCLWRARRTICMAAPTSTTRSAACRPLRPPGPRCSTRPGSRAPTTFAPYARRVRKPVNVLMGMKGAPPLSVQELGRARRAPRQYRFGIQPRGHDRVSPCGDARCAITAPFGSPRRPCTCRS